MKAEEIFSQIKIWCDGVKVLSAGVDGHTESVLLHPEAQAAMVRRGDTRTLTKEAAAQAVEMIRAARWPQAVLVDVSPAGVQVFALDFADQARFEIASVVEAASPTFRRYDVFRRPDGRIIVLMTRLSPTTWGADFLEDTEGNPDPNGYVACDGIVVTEEDLQGYKRKIPMDVKTRLKDLIDAAHRAHDFAATHFRRHDDMEDAERVEQEAWELMLHYCNAILTHCYLRS